jgi:adenine/guanine phosphoribosyltransferase-like PRPP-binding protein
MGVSYIRKALDPKTLKKIALGTYKVYKEVNADVIVARGLSGSIIASAVGAKYGVPFAIVRKPMEGSHSAELIEMATEGKTYKDWIIVDDFISSGNTIRTIMEAVEKDGNFNGKCKAIVLYNDMDKDHRFTSDKHGDVPVFRIET